MFEYTHSFFNVYGFKKIVYLDENKLEFEYKQKRLLVYGCGLKIVNMIDKSLQVKGCIEKVEIKYLGDHCD